MENCDDGKVPDVLAKKIDELCAAREFCNQEMKASGLYSSIIEENNKFLSTQTKGGLNQKEKLLGLLGMHTISGTEQNIEFSVTAALQAGVGEAQIRDMLNLSLLTGGGQAVSRVQFASAVLRHRLGGASKPLFDFMRRSA